MASIAKKLIAAAASIAIAVSAIPIASALTVSNEAIVSASSSGTREGFVYADGTKFMLDGSPYYYAGTNCYYLTFKPKSAVDNVFDDAQAMGLKVIRVWGNLDVGVITDQINSSNGAPVFTDNNDGSGEKDGYYFQYFDPDLGRPVVNEGENGIQSLDYAIYQAEQHDMKLLITFTNYWDAFGGMGQYVKWAKQVGVSNLVKEDFYTNELLKGWYKDYIKTLLNHTNVYTGRKLKDEPAVFAWELANEPRCSTDAYCVDDVLYSWAKEMSEYVKSIDPYHMVSIGDEGFFNKPYGYYDEYTTSNYPFYGSEGVDFEKLMTIETVDFGTPHLYLDQWGLKFKDAAQDDLLWFKIHGEVCHELNKPVILEEFGLTDRTVRDSEYDQWFDVLEGNVYENVEYAGTNYWMIASYIDGALYPDYDQYTVYGPEGTETETTRQLIIEHAANMARKNIVNFVTPTSSSFCRSCDSDIVFNATMKTGAISGVSLDGKNLTAGTDYTINGNTITIKASFLKTLELSKHTFKMLCTAGDSKGYSPEFTIDVSDCSIPNPEINPEMISVDANPRYCEAVAISMDLKTSEFRGISNNGVALVAGTDYTVSGSTVTLTKSYLTSLNEGTVVLTFDFYEGKDCELTINVADTSSIDTFDSFEDYTSDADLQNAYTANTNGNTVELALVEKNGSQAMAFTYNVGNPNYCGVNHPISKRDVSSFEGVELWVQGDGSGNSLTVQLMDANNQYFEKTITVDFTGGKTIQIPFSEFAAPSWQGSGVLDTTAVTQFSIYAGSNGNTTTGTYYIDDIFLYRGDVVEKEGAYLLNNSGSYDGNNSVASILVKMFLGGASVDSISCNGKALVANSDYSWNGSQVLLNESYLKNLSDGTYNLVFAFSDGNTDTFTVTVTNNGGSVDEHTHSYTVESKTDATCTATGSVTYACECGDSYTETIAATGHNYNSELVSGSCTTAGYVKYTCANCGYTKTEYTQAPGHNYEETSKTDATCTENGSVTYTCTNCGDSYTKTIEATGHSYSVKEVVAPTATEKGYTVYTCANCGHTYNDDFVDPTGEEETTETVIYTGNASCGYWGQALSLDTLRTSGKLDPAIFTEGGYLAVTITNGNANEARIILQSWSGGPNWQSVKPSSVEGNVAKWTYADIMAAYGTDLNTLNRLHIAVENSNLTVSKVSYFGSNGTVVPDIPEDDDDYQGKYNQYFYGYSSCGNWGQAVGVDTAKNGGPLNTSDIVSSGYFYVEYNGDMDKIELIFQSWSGGSGWLRMQPTETGTCSDGSYYAKWSYASVIEAYGSNLSTIDKVYVGASDGNIGVYKLQYAY